jgi:hypothetical protein
MGKRPSSIGLFLNQNLSLFEKKESMLGVIGKCMFKVWF